MGKTEDLKSFAARQQKQYLAHVIRNDDSTLTKKFLFDGTRTRRGGKHFILKHICLRVGVQERATKLKDGLEDLDYEEHLKNLGLATLRSRRFRGNLIEIYKHLHS